jgi:hypothetical protein
MPSGRKRRNLTGKKFGTYTVLMWVDAVKQWMCQCECGKRRLITPPNLTRQRVSCQYCNTERAARSAIEKIKAHGIEIVGVRKQEKKKSKYIYVVKCTKCGEPREISNVDDKCIGSGMCRKCYVEKSSGLKTELREEARREAIQDYIDGKTYSQIEKKHKWIKSNILTDILDRHSTPEQKKAIEEIKNRFKEAVRKTCARAGVPEMEKLMTTRARFDGIANIRDEGELYLRLDDLLRDLRRS